MNTERSTRTIIIGAVITTVLLGALAISVSGASVDLSSPSPVPSPSGADPAFDGAKRALTDQEARWMTGETWHKGCPVPINKLRLLTVTYRNFDDVIGPGRVVVHRTAATKMIGVFRKLYKRGFQIEHLDTVDLYPPDERPDNLRNVSSSFNCRTIAGSSSWSQHAYGLAIDINPVQNPWVDGKDVVPNAGKAYVDRSQDLPGMIHKGDGTVRAFAGISWEWGGKWRTLKDYMHFSLTGG